MQVCHSIAQAQSHLCTARWSLLGSCLVRRVWQVGALPELWPHMACLAHVLLGVPGVYQSQATTLSELGLANAATQSLGDVSIVNPDDFLTAQTGQQLHCICPLRLVGVPLKSCSREARHSCKHG